MNNKVTHAAHFISGNFRILCANIFGNLDSCFPNDNQVSDHRIHSFSILDKGLEFHPLRVFPNSTDGI